MGFGDLDAEPISDGEEEDVGVDLVVVDSEEDEGSGNIRNVVGMSRIRGNGIMEKEGVLIDSCFEEPVDLSQANALNFVDQFVSSNRVEYSPLVQIGDPVRKVSPDSRSSGSQTIARYIMSRTKERKTGAFEWDDSGEHEEGDLDFFGGGVNASSDSRRDTNEFSNENVCWIMRGGQNSSDNGSRNIAGSDHEDKCSVHSRDAANMEGKNCELDLIRKYAERRTEELNSVASNHQLQKCIAKTIDLESHDVGFSNQIAAEAMEALSHDHLKQDCPGPPKLVNSGKLSVQDSNFYILEGILIVPKRKRSKARRGTNKLIWNHCSFRAAAEFPETAENPRIELPTRDLSDNISLPVEQSLARKLLVCEGRKKPVLEQENHQSPLTTIVSRGKRRAQANALNQGNGDEINGSKLMRTRKELDGHKERRNAVAESPLITYRRRKILGKQQIRKNSQINWNGIREDGSTKTIFRSNELGGRRNTMAGSPLITYRRKKSLAKRQARGNAQMNWNGMTDSRSTRPICRSGEHGERMDSRAAESPIITYKRKMKQSEVSSSGLKLSAQSSEVDMNSLQNQEKKISMDNTAKTCLLHLHAQGRLKGKMVRRPLPRLTRAGNNDDKSMDSKMEDYHQESFNIPVSPDSAHNVILKDIRKRRNVRVVSVLFSQHLDDNILKQQKRITSRMHIPVASCLTDATHFIADRFARTRNMLEAISLGKPVVTHLWLESCCQVGCLIDEKSYILRDAKKEKEFGFSLPISLSRALQHPLLKGWRVLVTPNVKPNRDTILSLVKAAHGEIAEHDQTKAHRNPAQLLILSCEEDYAICLPFLEQGAPAYSPELILNGTVIQKLEYERHQLFMHHMKQ